MPRKTTKSLQRKLSPDRKYNSVLVQRLINKVMLDGKKQVAERAVYDAMAAAAKKLKSDDPLAVFEKAIKNVYPSLEVKSRRVGGANYQIPFPVAGNRNSRCLQPNRRRLQEEGRHSSYGRSKPRLCALCTRIVSGDGWGNI